MTGGALPPLRNDRTAAARGSNSAPRGGAVPPADSDPEGQARIATQRAAFDYDAAERAEIEREHEALQALLMAFLKNEDEIMKKWIALI